MQQIQNLSTLS